MEPTTALAVYSRLDLPLLSVGQTVLVLLVILPSAAVLGWWFGRNRRLKRIRSGQDIDLVVGETTLGAILAILGLLLAFSFGNALSLFETRKGDQIDEAAAIGTAFLRADYLADPGRTELQKALLAYAETRVVPDDSESATAQDVLEFFETTLQKQALLWPITLQATAEPTPPPIQAFVAGAVNEVLDMHLYRIGSLAAPISDYAYLMVLATAITALFLLGDRAGMLGRALTWRVFVLSGFMTVVMVTVVDLERNQQGLIRSDQTPLRATIFDMQSALAGR